MTGPFRIVIVDDEPAMTITLSRAAVHLGYQVRAANSAPEALDLLAVESADIVVVDIMLRGMNGCALARVIVGRWTGTRILSMTGYDHEVSQLGECTGIPVLRKPFTPGQFRDWVQRTMAEEPWTPKGAT